MVDKRKLYHEQMFEIFANDEERETANSLSGEEKDIFIYNVVNKRFEYLKSINDSLDAIAGYLMIIARNSGTAAYNSYNCYGNGYPYGTNPFSLMYYGNTEYRMECIKRSYKNVIENNAAKGVSTKVSNVIESFFIVGVRSGGTDDDPSYEYKLVEDPDNKFLGLHRIEMYSECDGKIDIDKLIDTIINENLTIEEGGELHG